MSIGICPVCKYAGELIKIRNGQKICYTCHDDYMQLLEERAEDEIIMNAQNNPHIQNVDM